MVARVNLAPAISTKVLLQRWTGTTWVGVTWVQLSNGLGSKVLTATKRGYYAYRFVVPGITYQGRWISTTVSDKSYVKVN